MGENKRQSEKWFIRCCLEFRDEQDVLCLKSLRPTVKKSILIRFIPISGYVPGRRANYANNS